MLNTMPWYTDTEGGSMLSLPNGALYLHEGGGGFRLEYRTAGGPTSCVIQSWVINVPSLYEARRLAMDMVRNYLLSEAQYLQTTNPLRGNPTVGVNYDCSQPTYTGCGKPKVGCCTRCQEVPCKCKRVQPIPVGGNCGHV